MNIRWVLAALLIALVIGGIYTSQNADMSAQYAQALREAELSAYAKEIILGAIALAVIAYIGWFSFFRQDSD